MKEFLQRHILPGRPSKELEEFFIRAVKGENEEIPVYGQGAYAFLDYYGRNKEGSELARVRIPWGKSQKLEKSYYVTRTSQGSYKVKEERIYAYKGD